MRIRTGLILVLIAALAKTGSAQGQGGVCLSQQATAAALVADVQRRILYSRGDSAHLARGGLLQVDTSHVSLVVDDALCTAAVAAYNREKPGAALTQAYVVRAGVQRYVVWDMRDPTAHYRDIMIFDANWALLKWFVG